MLLNTERVCFCPALLNLNLLTFMPEVYIYGKKLSMGHKLKKELHSVLLTQQEDLRKFWVIIG